MRESNFLVRRMSPGDTDAVVELWKGTVAYHAGIDARLEVREGSEEEFRRFLTRIVSSREDVIILVAEVDGEVVGFLIGMVRERTPVFIRSIHGYITDIYVDPGFRRRGIGRRLVETAVEWFAARGLDHVRLQVAAANAAGIAFWKNLGFEDYFLELWKEIG